MHLATAVPEFAVPLTLPAAFTGPMLETLPDYLKQVSVLEGGSE
jgi:hypothetical protein